jgi:predicted metalloprotease with PDZ domain
MTRWMASTLGLSSLLAAGLVVAPARADKADRPVKVEKREKVEKRVERWGGAFGPSGGRLGVRLAEVEKDDRGALVKSVEEGSAAEKAGIQEGDVILRYQGEAVLSASQLARMVRETPGGRTVAVEVSRGGSPQALSVTVAEGRDGLRLFEREIEDMVPPVPPMAELMPEAPELPEMPALPRHPAAPHPPRFQWKGEPGDESFVFRTLGPRKLGIQFQEIEGQLAQYFKLSGERGVLVTSVEKDGPAGKAGLKAGDVILKFDGKSVEAGDDLRDQVRRTEGGKDVAVTVQRDGRTLEVKVQLANPDAPRRAGGVKL